MGARDTLDQLEAAREENIRLEADNRRLERENAGLRKEMHLGIQLDNHHNAALCPYCNPDGWVFVPRVNVAFKAGTPEDSDVVRLRIVARNLRTGFEVGGSHTKEAIAKLCDDMARAMEDYQ
ncbi:hypothetical protein [Subtercola sp. YIM 133946]|uniref:hypothetical protein n=1 Tax=Subtercola sp. YIM 133946 TaxID=3118909 RepID=UPI002F9504CF